MIKKYLQTNLFELNEIKVSYKADKSILLYDQIIRSSSDSEKAFRQIYNANVGDTLEFEESAYVLFLRRNNGVIGYAFLSTGGYDSTIIEVRKVYSIALLCRATSIIMCHNHPSGNLTPSTADIKITQKLVEAGKIIDIQCLDHLILTDEGYTSFADKGLI